MNNKEHFESDQAIDLTARALGETNTSSSQSANAQNSAAQMEVEFEQVRELGRVVRDSNNHNEQQWADPEAAAELKELITSEFISSSVTVSDNTGQVRLAALAATVLLMAGIGYVLVRTPPRDVSGISKLEPLETLEQDSAHEVTRGESPEVESPKLPDALVAITDAVSSTRNELERVDVEAMGRGMSETDPAKDANSNKPTGDFAVDSVTADPVTIGKFDQQGRASDPSLLPARQGLPMADGSGGTTIHPPASPDVTVTLPEEENKSDMVFRSMTPETRSQSNFAVVEEQEKGMVGEKSESTSAPGITLEDGEILLGNGADVRIVPAPEPNGTTVQIPKFAESGITSSTSVPGGGTVLLGGIKSIRSSGDAPIGDTYLATPDLDIPFVQNSFGATPPQFGGYGEQSGDASGGRGVAMEIEGDAGDSFHFSGERQVRRGGESDLREVLERLDESEKRPGNVRVKIVDEIGSIVLAGAPDDTEKVQTLMREMMLKAAANPSRTGEILEGGEVDSINSTHVTKTKGLTADQMISELNKALADEYRNWETIPGPDTSSAGVARMAAKIVELRNELAANSTDSKPSEGDLNTEELFQLQEQLEYYEQVYAYVHSRNARIETLTNAISELRARVDRDERPSNEQYELPPENQFLKPVDVQALSTFSIDVDTASYANTRRFITNGQLPPGNAVRIEEMVNYFGYAYPQPIDEKPFSVSLDVAQCPWQPANKLVRVGIQGRDIPRDDRPASNLVFLIDVSGSMSDQNKLPLLQQSMLRLVDQLTENDRVSIVTYASNAGVRLQPTSGDQKQVIRDVINSLSSGGSTHGSAGITTAYELATQHFIEGGTNRVILATDGDLNVGVTDDDSLVQLIKSKAESGVFLSVLGFGTGNLKDGKLEKIADNGNGQYCYIDSIREAQKVLVAEMSGSLVTIAKDVKLQIEFNPAEVAGYRLIGYENRALKNEDFANDQVDAGDIGAGHSVTAFYEIIPVRAVATPAPAPVAQSTLRYQKTRVVAAEKSQPVDDDMLYDAARTGDLMTVALRFKQPESSESDLMEVTVKDSNQSFDAAPADFRFAASVAAFGMKLRQSAYAGNWTWSDIENIAVSTIGDDPQGHRAELVDLVRQTRKLLGR